MTTTSTTAAPVRASSPRSFNPWNSNYPDPRPVTDYSVAVSSPSGNLRITVSLSQACAIRSPNWAFINCTDGSLVYAPTMVVVDNKTFYFQFVGDPGTSISFIQAPIQDTNVQNGLGGFARPSATWFRKPT